MIRPGGLGDHPFAPPLLTLIGRSLAEKLLQMGGVPSAVLTPLLQGGGSSCYVVLLVGLELGLELASGSLGL